MTLLDTHESTNPQAPVNKQSPLGAAALILAIIYVVMVLASVVYLTIAVSSGSGMDDDASDAGVMLGIAIVVGALLNLVGLGLAIGGLYQKRYKKGMAIASVIIHSFFLLILLVLFFIGITVA